MSQLTIFEFTNELPQKGDVFQWNNKKIRIIGILPGWKAEFMTWKDDKGFAGGMPVEEFKQSYEKGEFVRV